MATGVGPHGGVATVLRDVPPGKSPQIAVAGPRLYLGYQDEYELRLYTARGHLSRIVSLAQAPIPVTNTARQAYIDGEVSGIDDPDRQRQRRAELEAMPAPGYLPAHGMILAEADGYFLVERYRLQGDTVNAFDVFDPEGILSARLDLPAGVRPLDLGPDHLLGLYTDELGVEQILLFDLRRS